MRDLLGELERESDDAAPLHERLARVRRSSEGIWDSPRLPWFTDHTPQIHSEQLIRLLGQIVDHLQSTDKRLSRSELFILMSACYLHDIGMQDLIIGERGIEELTVDDYELVRKRHPERGKELIVKRSLRLEEDQFHVDLDDIPGYLQPIAWVSQGHGSEFFEHTIDELSRLEWAPDGVGTAVRAQLLTALLLIGDELDIRSERCRFPKEATLSPISELHQFLNHFVIGTAVLKGPTSVKRRVQIRFEFPSESDHYRPDVRQVITDKLVRQIRRVNRVLEEGTDGELTFEVGIGISEQTDGLDVRRKLDGRALHELQRVAREADLVGRGEIVATLRKLFREEGSVSWVSMSYGAASDLSAILSWLAAEAAAADHHILRLGFRPTIAGDPLSVLAELGGGSGVSLGSSAAEKRPPRRGDPFFDQVLAQLKAEPSLVLIEDLDGAEPATQKLVLEIAEGLREEGSAKVVITHDGSVTAPADEEVDLGPLEEDRLTDYLHKKLGYDHEKAAQLAETYLRLSAGAAEPIAAIVAADRRAAQFGDG